MFNSSSPAKHLVAVDYRYV